MTGGQHVDGELSPQQITFQLHSEGIRDIYLVSENPDAYPASDIAPGTKTAHRDELDAVQKTLRKVKGASAIVFVQTCAAEKRRRRKRGTDGGSGAPRDDQSGRVRRLRRLLGAVELHFGRAAGNRDGAQAHHQSVDLQQGLFLPEGLLPVLRHRRRRQAAPPRAGRVSAISAICRSRPRGPRWSGPTTSRSAASAAPAC